MGRIKVENEKNLFRDSKTNAIINTDYQNYNNYINAKKIKESELKRIENIENDLSNLKSDLSEIKTILRSFINESRWHKTWRYE